ncbi:MAG TPA: glycosyltransferase family 2 protein [Anaerolineales bacterium]|nr:glycosyltransferase family 2 protein [Anaerolineales bacterium]
MTATVSVIVVNYNGRRFLKRCLDAVLAQTLPALEIIVVDNGSTDGSREEAAAYGPPVQLIALPDNRGFAAANNIGARVARGAWLALLNNDAFPEPDWLEALARAATLTPGANLVATQMVFDARPAMINSTGICIDRSGVVWDRQGGAATDTIAPVAPVFGPSGGAALIQREAWTALGGFNEDYFMYFEDVDFAWRARWLGQQAVVAPAAVVRHMHSASSGQASDRKTYWLARNKWLLLARNYPRPHFWRQAPLIAAYDLLSCAATGLVGRWGAAVRGRRDGIRLALAKARYGPAQAAAPAMADAVYSWLEPAIAPWRINARYAHLAGLGLPVR